MNWIQQQFFTDDEQIITVQPTPEGDGFVLEFCEANGSHKSPQLYICGDTCDGLIEMLKWAQEKYGKQLKQEK